MASLLGVSEVNKLGRDQFEHVFGNVIELCTDAAAKVEKERPFEDVAGLCGAFHKYLDNLSIEEKLVILKLHPDLAGRLAAKGELTPESAGEQRSAGLNELTDEQRFTINASNERKLVILNTHADLAGRLAAKGELTPESAWEQRSAGLNELTDEQRFTINARNERYKEKFGFPFIICARENKVQSIIKGLQERYNSTREQEIMTGINEVKKICKLRVLDIVKALTKPKA